MGFAGGSGSAAGGGELSNRATDRRGPLHHERPSQSSLPDCRASWKEGRTQGRVREGCEGAHWAHDVRSSAKLRTIHRSGGFPPQDGLFGEGGGGTVGSSRSAESIALRMNPGCRRGPPHVGRKGGRVGLARHVAASSAKRAGVGYGKVPFGRSLASGCPTCVRPGGS